MTKTIQIKATMVVTDELFNSSDFQKVLEEVKDGTIPKKIVNGVSGMTSFEITIESIT